MKRLSLAMLLVLLLAGPAVLLADEEPSAETSDDALRLARLIYGEGRSAVCFSESFLSLGNEQADLNLHPELIAVQLASDALFNTPTRS